MSLKSHDWDSSGTEEKSPNPTASPRMRLWFSILLEFSTLYPNYITVVNSELN